MRNNFVRKDKLRRKLFYKYEAKRRIYKFLRLNLKQNIYSKLMAALPKNSSITRIKNRCIITGRARSIYSDFKLSRMQIKNVGGFGYLNGIKRSSW